MGLASNPAMRKQVKNYRAYFNAKDRRLKVSTQDKVPATPAQLHMAVMAAICGLKDAQPNMIFRSVFRAGLDGFILILSRLGDTFISRISLTMLPVPNPHNTVCVLSWEEARHWQSRSSGYSSS